MLKKSIVWSMIKESLAKYVKNDFMKIHHGDIDASTVKLTCTTRTVKLIDCSKGELIIRGYIECEISNAILRIIMLSVFKIALIQS